MSMEPDTLLYGGYVTLQKNRDSYSWKIFSPVGQRSLREAADAALETDAYLRRRLTEDGLQV